MLACDSSQAACRYPCAAQRLSAANEFQGDLGDDHHGPVRCRIAFAGRPHVFIGGKWVDSSGDEWFDVAAALGATRASFDEGTFHAVATEARNATLVDERTRADGGFSRVHKQPNGVVAVVTRGTGRSARSPSRWLLRSPPGARWS